MATYSDNFNRANEDPLSGDWSTDLNAGLAIVSNQVKRATGSSPAMSSLDSLSWDNDQSAEIEYASHANYDILAVGVRFDGAGNGYIGFADDGRGYIARVTAGSRTLLDTNYGVTITNGDVFRLEVTGTSLELFQNDVSICTATDATYSSGAAGLYYDAGNSNLTLGDNFEATGHQAAGNQAPTETPPAPDISIDHTASGTIEDLSGHVNDPEGDTLTYSVSPALPSGLSLNTSSGVISANGSVAITAAADYTFTVDDGNSNTLDIVINIEVTSAFAIVSAPSEIKATEGFTVRISDPATVPTLGNTLVGFAASKIAPSSIDVIGGGVYDLNVTFPRTYPSVFSDTGFALEVTVNVETLSTSAIPYRPQTGYSFLTVASLNTSTEVYAQYSDTKPVNGDQAVYQPIVSPSGATVTLNPDTSWSIPDQTADQTSNLYFIQAAGTVGALDTITWTAPAEPTAPVMPADTSVNVAENTTTVDTFAASSGSPAPTYSLSGTDAALFSINSSTGAVEWLVARDYESDPLSYSITVTATNSEGSDSQNITVNVTNVVETPVLASTLALTGTVDSAFSRTLSIQSGDAATSWTITGGADQASYSINSSGVLSRTAPNDTAEDEVVTVTATNSAGTSNTQTVTITYSESLGSGVVIGVVSDAILDVISDVISDAVN